MITQTPTPKPKRKRAPRAPFKRQPPKQVRTGPLAGVPQISDRLKEVLERHAGNLRLAADIAEADDAIRQATAELRRRHNLARLDARDDGDDHQPPGREPDGDESYRLCIRDYRRL